MIGRRIALAVGALQQNLAVFCYQQHAGKPLGPGEAEREAVELRQGRRACRRLVAGIAGPRRVRGQQ
jgi:hypothetical protein